jgi:glutamyl-tRNA reductase
MNLSKSYEFFAPEKVRERIHIIGCGAVGSTIAELLARTGLTNITLYDFDRVESHNIANQMFTADDIGKLKCDALKEMMVRINPEAEKHITTVPEGYTGQRISGYVFLAVDNIDLRREICEKNLQNRYIKAVFDVRIRLEDAQHYAADWKNQAMVENLIASMQFTHEEAQAETPRSACNLELSIAPTVRDICSKAVVNFINFAKGGQLMKVVTSNPWNWFGDAFA